MTDETNPTKVSYLSPVITFGKVVVAFFDLATLMIRLLVNVFIYDDPKGKSEMTGS